MERLFGFFRTNYIKIIIVTLALVLCGSTLISKEQPRDPKIVAIVEIIAEPDGFYIKTQYNTFIFKDRCEVALFLLKDYYNTCADQQDPKIKKL